MMRAIWNALGFVAVVHLLAIAIVLAWLWQTGRLSAARLEEARKAIMVGSVDQSQESEDADAPAGRNIGYAGGALDSATSIQQAAFIRRHQQQAMRRLEDEQRMLTAGLEATLARMEADAAQLQKGQTDEEKARAAEQERKKNAQFQQAVKHLEQTPAKQAKKILEALIADNRIEQAVAYLNAMNQRAAAKVLREFKTDEEIMLAKDLLERVRTFGVTEHDPAAPDAPAPLLENADSRRKLSSIASP